MVKAGGHPDRLTHAGARHVTFTPTASLKPTSLLTTVTTYFVDHVQGALEHGVKDLRDLAGDVSPQLVDDGCHGAEDLGLTGGGDIALVVDEDGVQQRRNKVFPDLEEQRG